MKYSYRNCCIISLTFIAILTFTVVHSLFRYFAFFFNIFLLRYLVREKGERKLKSSQFIREMRIKKLIIRK